MKVLIAGAGGQVGSALQRAAASSVQINALSRAQLDITDAVATNRIVAEFAPDVIVNAAAHTAVDLAESEPEQSRLGNEAGPRHLAEAAARTGARLIHVSTDFVFAGDSSRPYQPTDEVRPLGVYGKTKAAGEAAVHAILPHRSVVLRTAWVYGVTGKNFVRTMLRLMSERGVVRVVADQIGTPTSAASVAQALWKFVENPQVHGTYHWTDAGVASWYDFAVAIGEEARSIGLISRDVRVEPIITQEYPTPARRPAFSVLDTRSTTAAVGLIPVHWRINLRAVLEEMKLA